MLGLTAGSSPPALMLLSKCFFKQRICMDFVCSDSFCLRFFCSYFGCLALLLLLFCWLCCVFTHCSLGLCSRLLQVSRTLLLSLAFRLCNFTCRCLLLAVISSQSSVNCLVMANLCIGLKLTCRKIGSNNDHLLVSPVSISANAINDPPN